jgi:glutamine amidotransferase
MIAIIDYGMGNLGSVFNALRSLRGDVKVTQKASDLKRADKIVLPGVGAFRDAMDSLARLKLIGPLKQELTSDKIYLGICLGLELLFEKSEEGNCKGIGVLKGNVVRFPARGRENTRLKVPHMGWNQVKIKRSDCPLFKGINDNAFFYFVHSYYVRPKDKDIVAAVTDYGGEFTSMVWKKNVFAVQYHPEKSQAVGLKFLENFIKL